MNHYSVNGQEKPAPLKENSTFKELMSYLSQELIREDSLVSCIRVDGIEINESDESALAGILLSELKSVEVTTSHPRELAEDTLQTLKVYAIKLAELSEELPMITDAKRASEQYSKLIDGLQTFVETLSAVKGLLHIGIDAPTQILEADLLSTMRDLLQANQTGNAEYQNQILVEHIPKNLRQWNTDGIPSLIRSRDS